MALRLRKDVQKASYYVWFLGAEEARGLRGPRVLLPAIPNLIERSREQEPLKVTLQVSQKGMKIVQGSSKHFITHSAITCSVQAEDIVACVLLLYNPTTKCPLHVHAYRCDSETTAQALHQFLQVLINRPENQKRFAELEARLGLQSMAISTPNLRPVQPHTDVFTPTKIPTETKTAVRRFESSLGSDTGTSTRESECSEELSPPLPKSSLYDSLAAELRAKLNGNGPPLLLPPRDYDTVHRSKGNLAATELRRCRNSLIVGDKVTKQQQLAALTSSRSRGSSGIGSDLAPSPERPEEHSSSDEDDWVQDHHLTRQPEQVDAKLPPRKIQPPRQTSYPTAVAPPLNAFNDQYAVEQINQPPSYLYPLSRDELEPYPYENDGKRHVSRSTSREKSAHPTLHRSVSQDEADIKPIIIRPRNYDSRFKHILDENQFIDVVDDADKPQLHKPLQAKQKVERKSRAPEELPKSNTNYGRYAEDEAKPTQRYRYGEEEKRKTVLHNDKYTRSSREALNVDRSSSERERDLFRENLTDREKYRESQKFHGRKDPFNGQDQSFERRHSPPRKSKYPLDNGMHSVDKLHHSYVEPQIAERSGFRPHRGGFENGGEHHDAKISRSFTEKPIKAEYDQPMPRNPYKEPESLPYRESIESMIKSPAMRYKSFETNSSVEGAKLANVQPTYPAPEKVRDTSIRYHSLEAEKYMAEQKSKYGPEPSSRRRAIEKQRSSHNGSPDTVCRVSPKDRFNNAREKFEAMDRERSYVQSDNRQQQQVRQIEPSHHQRHQSPSRRDRAPNQPRYPPQESKVDWSSEDEQHSPSRRTTNGYRDIPTGPSEGYGDHSRAMGPSKSLNNLARGGYRHSYAEPMRAQLPRNSGRVGLAAVNPY